MINTGHNNTEKCNNTCSSTVLWLLLLEVASVIQLIADAQCTNDVFIPLKRQIHSRGINAQAGTNHPHKWSVAERHTQFFVTENEQSVIQSDLQSR